MNTNSMQDKPVPWHHRILKDQPESDPQYWSDSLRLVYVMKELEEYRLAFPNPLAEPVQPVEVDQATMELAESVGLIGPTSRTHELHAAIQRFHDLICANATIKAAKMAADAIRESTPTAAPAMAYSLDADPSGIRKRAADAIIGALALGAQDSSPPPEGHWLQQFWDIGRTEASRATPPSAQPAVPLTDEQILDLAENCTAQYHDLLSFARAVLAAAQPAPTGKAPCARHCEANAFKITIRGLRGEIERMKVAQQEVTVPDDMSHAGQIKIKIAPDGDLHITTTGKDSWTGKDCTVAIELTGRGGREGAKWYKIFRDVMLATANQPAAAQPAQQEVTVPDLTHDAWDEWQDKHSLILEREALDDLRSMLAKAQPTPCTWTKAPDPNMPDTFSATCGVVWTFSEGGPAENGMVFCPGCGSKVTKGGAG
jgi:hypothetical protein